jgi:hypothetical protein
MAHTTPLRLKVVTDRTEVTELAPRVHTAVTSTLTAVGIPVSDAVAAAVTGEIMTEIIRVRQATPEETAQAQAIERVRALHRDEYGDGSCAECTHESSVSYPCATVRALDGQEQP